MVFASGHRCECQRPPGECRSRPDTPDTLLQHPPGLPEMPHKREIGQQPSDHTGAVSQNPGRILTNHIVHGDAFRRTILDFTPFVLATLNQNGAARPRKGKK